MSIDLLELKNEIEILSKIQQVEILRKLKEYTEININENKNGIFINLSELNENIINDLHNYLKYIKEQQYELNEIESKKQEIENIFFNEDKDNDISKNSKNS